MLIGNIILVIINLPLAIPLVQILRVPTRIMLPIIMGLALIGTYFLNYSSFDFVVVMIAAVIGFMFVKIGIPLPPLVLALILGSTTEQMFRNSMVLSDGNPMIFLQKPISAAFLVIAVASLVFALVKNSRKKKAA